MSKGFWAAQVSATAMMIALGASGAAFAADAAKPATDDALMLDQVLSLIHI